MDNNLADPPLTLIALPDFPLVEPGADLVELIAEVCEISGPTLADGDVVVVAQKIVSKAEGRYVDLATVTPGDKAMALAAEVQKDPRLVEVILGESDRIVRHREGVLIVEHKLGFVVANAGIDQSNVDPQRGLQPVLLLPRDPDASAQVCAKACVGALARWSGWLSTIVSAAPWRLGTVGVALGAAGLPALLQSPRQAGPLRTPFASQ